MAENQKTRDWAAIARREWWLVAAVMVVAVAVAFAWTAGDEDVYYGEASLIVDTNTVSRYADILVPEALLKEVRADSFVDLAADAAGIESSELKSGLNAYSTGNPQDRVVLEYAAADEQEALRVAGILGEAAIQLHLTEGSASIGQYQNYVDLTDEMIATLEAHEPVASEARTLEEAAISRSQSLYSYNISRLSYGSTLRLLENAYMYDGEATVEVASAADAARNAAIAAALAGLAVGLALAILREGFIFRAARAREE